MTAIGITDVGEVIYKGEALHAAAIVTAGSTVTKGNLLKISSGADTVEPATAAAKICGIALYDAAAGEEVTYAIPSSDFMVRAVLAESQTIAKGDSLCAATSSISGVTYLGQVGKQADATFGGTYSASDDAGLLTQIKGFVGFAAETISTSADQNKVIKVILKGASL
jgi:hypothetical protein